MLADSKKVTLRVSSSLFVGRVIKIFARYATSSKSNETTGTFGLALNLSIKSDLIKNKKGLRCYFLVAIARF